MIRKFNNFCNATITGVAAILMWSGCGQPVSSQDGPQLYETQAFKDYWFAGKAELNSYRLIQSRYGESREGNAMLIFVTEGFSKRKQVKLDEPEAAGTDKVSVLKLNFTKNFVTGIYPYSMMMSVFTPVSHNQFPNTLKVTMSSQEWCGHVFTQMNLRGKRYEINSYSYFEKEGDQEFERSAVLLEDELFNLIRLDPEAVPTGEVELLPGLFFTRLKHKALASTRANITRTDHVDHIQFQISYSERTLSLQVEQSFPHKILGWEETWTEEGQQFQTKATLNETLITDYWRKNKEEFKYLRDSLGLSPKNY